VKYEEVYLKACDNVGHAKQLMEAISSSTTRKDDINRLTGKHLTASTVKLMQGEWLNVRMHLSVLSKYRGHFW